ncbi:MULTISPECIES: hypothetical protein [Staphylococcus]|uniref:hypothetical protein n=1 Tax=Staphylococcus TaxID=1279 RepID=UPI0021C1399D|nr:hypothetical protein [Staphylococcus equorum]
MKINQRYVKVFVLYFISVLLSNILMKDKNLVKILIQTIIGYIVFALGLKNLKRQKTNRH